MALKDRVATIMRFARIPIALAALASIVGMATTPFERGVLGDVALISSSLALYAAAGWLVVRRGCLGLWDAAAAGGLVMFVDVAIAGLWFLVEGERAATGGVVLSYLMFFVIGMAAGCIGGAVAKWTSNENVAI
jgi:hypothetical protein